MLVSQWFSELSLMFEAKIYKMNIVQSTYKETKFDRYSCLLFMQLFSGAMKQAVTLLTCIRDNQVLTSAKTTTIQVEEFFSPCNQHGGIKFIFNSGITYSFHILSNLLFTITKLTDSMQPESPTA
jgi:hypothetical protein